MGGARIFGPLKGFIASPDPDIQQFLLWTPTSYHHVE